MLCDKCSSKKARVLESRLSNTGIVRKRKRQCLDCGHKYSTIEYEYPSDERMKHVREAIQNLEKEMFKLTGVEL